MLKKSTSLLFQRWLIITILLCFWAVIAGANDAKQILIISNASNGPYPQVISGFKTQLSAQLNVAYTEYNVAQIKADSALLNSEIHDHPPDLIFALGTDATVLAKQNTKSIPIVTTLVLKNELFNAGTTGVSLAYPLSTQIQWLKKIFPNQSKVAVLFNPVENTKAVQALKKIVEQNGLELIAIPVETPKQLPDALEQLAKNIELLFAIPDDVSMSPKTAKEVLLSSFRNRVPLIGLSDQWVKAGALYALSWDYDDLGQQCALQSQKILNGMSILQVAPETPRKLTYTINTKIAEHMNIEMSDSLLKNAKTLF
jgi:putative ABC transport system substrate-binding protein